MSTMPYYRACCGQSAGELGLPDCPSTATAGDVETSCEKCNGAGWLWWNELDSYTGPATETGQDDNRYLCDACCRLESA